MEMVHAGTENNYANDSYKDRRITIDRRVTLGRRDMIRFDVTGGDRRSGEARRETDIGLIQGQG